MHSQFAEFLQEWNRSQRDVFEVRSEIIFFNNYQKSLNFCYFELRYIYKLYDLHIQADNYTEAGFTLKLYADMLCWSKESLTFAPNDEVGQLEYERKENLYKQVCFDYLINDVTKLEIKMSFFHRF